MWLLLICGLAARRVPRILSPCSNSLSLSLSFILSLSLIRSLSLSLLKRSRIGVKRSRSHRQVFILSSVTLSCSWSFCFCVCILSFFLCNPFVPAFSQLSVLSLTLCKMLSISCLYLGVKSLAIFMLWFYSHLSHRGQVEKLLRCAGLVPLHSALLHAGVVRCGCCCQACSALQRWGPRWKLPLRIPTFSCKKSHIF